MDDKPANMKDHIWTGERLEPEILGQVSVEHWHRYAVAADYAAGKDVLDIACGTGYGSHMLAAVARSVIAIDIDEATIKKATYDYQKPNLHFKTGNIVSIPCNDHSTDLVTCFETLEHITEHDRLMGELKRTLRPQGMAIISTPDKKFYSDLPGYQNPFHAKELYRAEFIGLLKKHFQFVHLSSQAFLQGSFFVDEDNTFPSAEYAGNFSGLRQPSRLNMTYMVAFVSDDIVKAPSSSYFTAHDALHDAIRQKELAVKGSLSYRIGHSILLPFKKMRGVFKK